jgi:hypothetical protein
MATAHVPREQPDDIEVIELDRAALASHWRAARCRVLIG